MYCIPFRVFCRKDNNSELDEYYSDEDIVDFNTNKKSTENKGKYDVTEDVIICFKSVLQKEKVPIFNYSGDTMNDNSLFKKNLVRCVLSISFSPKAKKLQETCIKVIREYFNKMECKISGIYCLKVTDSILGVNDSTSKTTVIETYTVILEFFIMKLNFTNLQKEKNFEFHDHYDIDKNSKVTVSK